jgi:O-methyltransferase
VDPHKGTAQRALLAPFKRMLDARGMQLVRRFRFDPESREVGLDWPPEAETMIGIRRLDNIEMAVTDVLKQGVPGDLIETGVWRGGATIFMRAILEAYGDKQRTVWVADSFEGLPKPDPRHESDVKDAYWRRPVLAASLGDVRANFEKYDLLDDQVRFLPGWFRETLPKAPIDRLAVLRLDGDLYESTMDALQALYPKVSVGGYVIVDDYNIVPGCHQAVDEYRAQHGIDEELVTVDWGCVYWRRER